MKLKAFHARPPSGAGHEIHSRQVSSARLSDGGPSTVGRDVSGAQKVLWLSHSVNTFNRRGCLSRLLKEGAQQLLSKETLTEDELRPLAERARTFG